MTAATNGGGGPDTGSKNDTSAMSETEISDVFDAFRRAFGDRDTDALVALWTPDVRVWHSVDGRAKDRDEYLVFISELPRREVEFLDVRREFFPNGFVQQQRVHVGLPDGQHVESAMCLIVKMENGRISRIDEYSA